MQIELYQDPAIFTQLAPEWNLLLERAVTRVPFLRAEYQAAWWQHRGGGEWPASAELWVAVGRGAEGELRGVAPLFLAPNREGQPALHFIGGVEISDYLDLIVARADAEAFCQSLLECLATEGVQLNAPTVPAREDGAQLNALTVPARKDGVPVNAPTVPAREEGVQLNAPTVPAWEVLDLFNIPATSPTRGALARAAAARGWTVSEQLLQPVPAIALPDDWETYLATMVEKKERQEIRRKMRRAEGGEDKVTWSIVDGGAGQDVDAASEAFMALMAHNADKARFLTPAMRAQFTDIVRVMARQGWLRLAFLEVNGEKAAAYLNFDYGNRLWIYNSAIDPRFNALSPGWVLLGYLLRWAIENKRQAFDFLRGDEDYKFRFGAVAGKIYRVQASRAAPLERLGGEPACMLNEFESDFFPAGD